MVEIATQGRPCSLAELARSFDMPKSTIKRILDTLVDKRFLAREGDGYKIDGQLARIRAQYRNAQRAIIARAQKNLDETFIKGEDRAEPGPA